MRLTLIAVGRLRAGPERDLVSDYLQRFDKTGRALGLGPVTLREVEDKRGGGMAAGGCDPQSDSKRCAFVCSG